MAVSACGPSYQTWESAGPTRYCVDRNNVRVPDNQCGGSGSGFTNWYYVSRGGYVPYVGEPYDGRGSYRPAAGARYASAPSSYSEAQTVVSRSGGTVRGGFGSSVSAHGSSGGHGFSAGG